jgi:hypothetical protein
MPSRPPRRPVHAWTFTTHLVITGSSDETKSNPEGLNVDLKWNPWRTDIEEPEARSCAFRSTRWPLGVGAGFRF